MTAASPKRQRCAVYTRKSSEEGLEQDFNSLHAQREACEAYIQSQRHEGWRLVKRSYDDGGLSGGNLDRPALQALLDDVLAGRIDVVVVYKIDRLSRALTDFAMLAELFDEHSVSFVSVTQQFNTTTSMGRLMLNVLLSFAQFEREITSERIRDKIAASKKKGMWMGGVVPLGYDSVDKKLTVNPVEAQTVKQVFELYLEFGNVNGVFNAADDLGLITKPRTVSGNETGGTPLQRGHIYKILRNPLYSGQVHHRGKLYPGQHNSIVDIETWERVQSRLGINSNNRPAHNSGNRMGLLVGLVRDCHGRRLTHTHAAKGERRYRYYSTIMKPGEDPNKPLRIPAEQIEARVCNALKDWLLKPTMWLAKLLRREPTAKELRRTTEHGEQSALVLNEDDRAAVTDLLQSLIQSVVVGAETLELRINTHEIARGCDLQDVPKGSFVHHVPCQFVNRGGQMKLIVRPDDESTGGIDEALIRSIATAHQWFEQLKDGSVSSIRDIASREKLSTSYVMRYVRLAFLAPDIVEAILDGTQPPGISVRKLTNNKQLPSDWTEQRRLLGFPRA